MKKRLFYIFIFIFIFIIGTTNVYAGGNALGVNRDPISVCSGGLNYNITFIDVQTPNKPFSIQELMSIIKNNNDFKNKTNAFLTHPTDAQISAGGFEFGFVMSNGGKFGTIVTPVKNQYDSRCFTVVNESYGEYSGSYSYTTKTCGEKYKLKKNDNYTMNIKSENNGTTTIKFTPKAGTNLAERWNDVYVKVEYNGADINGTDGKGTCKHEGGNIVCRNIKPYTPLYKIENGKEVPNSDIYKITFYLDKVYSIDFFGLPSSQIPGFIEDCGGYNGQTYIGGVQVQIANADLIKVPNPSLKSGTDAYKLCEEVKRVIPSENILKAYLNEECYKTEISYPKSLTLIDDISKKYTNLQRIYAGISQSSLLDLAGDDNLYCNTTHKVTNAGQQYNVKSMGIPVESQTALRFDSKLVYENYGTYWGMVCFEDYYIDGGKPALVQAGMGFEYTNKVQVNKTCSIVQLQEVYKKEECNTYTSYEIRCDHNGDGSYDLEDRAGGPSESFDKCIEQCDNGKYTQKCINTCYSKIYDNETVDLNDNKLTSYNYSNPFNLNRMSNVYDGSFGQDEAIGGSGATIHGGQGSIELGGGLTLTMQPGPYCMTIDGNYFCEGAGNYKPTLTDSQGHVLAETTYWGLCGAECSAFASTYTGPSGCVNNSRAIYDAEVDASIAEYNNYLTLAKSKSEIYDYTIEITDSKTGVIYKVSGSSYDSKQIDGPRLVIEKDDQLSSIKEYKQVLNFGNQSGDTNQNLVTSSVNTTVYNIKMPNAYIKEGNHEVEAVENSSQLKYYGYTKFAPINGVNYYIFNEFENEYGYPFDSRLFTENGNYYYTDFHSPKTNVLSNPQGYTEEMLASHQYVSYTLNKTKILYVLLNDGFDPNVKVSFTIGGNQGISREPGSAKNEERTGKYEFKLFDSSKFKCYYGVYPLLYTDQDPDDPITIYKPSTNGALRFYYREIDLNDVFPNGRSPRWNWTGTKDANGNVTGAADYSNSNYPIDPELLTRHIESLGDSIYDIDSEVDYEFTLTPALIREIRRYNQDGDNLSSGRVSYLDFSLTTDSQHTYDFSRKIEEWYAGTLANEASYITQCNNAYNSKCDISLQIRGGN